MFSPVKIFIIDFLLFFWLLAIAVMLGIVGLRLNHKSTTKFMDEVRKTLAVRDEISVNLDF